MFLASSMRAASVPARMLASRQMAMGLLAIVRHYSAVKKYSDKYAVVGGASSETCCDLCFALLLLHCLASACARTSLASLLEIMRLI